METKTNEPVKQEGEFKIKKKTTPKKLVETKDNVTKVNINSKEPLVEVPNNVTKVEIKKQEDAIQIGETKEVPVEKPSGNSAEMGESVQESNETTEGFSPIKEVTEEEVREVKEAIRDERVLGKALPENIEKLVSFMEETGGTIEDYTRLNADYTNVDDDILLKEYYKKSKPHLDLEEINFIMEENFDYDTDLDEEREVKKKKLAKKEEIAKAKNFLEETKNKYYDEIKLRPGVTQDQQKAMDFFNRYNEDQETAIKQHEDFKSKTNSYFNDEFKGFEFDVSGKKFRYGVADPSKLAEDQSNINNFVGKFLNKEGEVTDAKGYHKALFMASNADTIINHFYEQGKSDATKDIVGKSKNPSTQARQTAQTGFVNGLKVKSISSLDSSKLRIKTKKFN